MISGIRRDGVQVELQRQFNLHASLACTEAHSPGASEQVYPYQSAGICHARHTPTVFAYSMQPTS